MTVFLIQAQCRFQKPSTDKCGIVIARLRSYCRRISGNSSVIPCWGGASALPRHCWDAPHPGHICHDKPERSQRERPYSFGGFYATRK